MRAAPHEFEIVLRFVAERTEVGEAREALFAVTIPEERGSFKRFCAWRHPATSPSSITDLGTPPLRTCLSASVPDAGDNQTLARQFRRHGYATEDLSHDELRPSMCATMVAARASTVGEMIYRFEFPQRPAH